MANPSAILVRRSRRTLSRSSECWKHRTILHLPVGRQGGHQHCGSDVLIMLNLSPPARRRANKSSARQYLETAILQYWCTPREHKTTTDKRAGFGRSIHMTGAFDSEASSMIECMPNAVSYEASRYVCLAGAGRATRPQPLVIAQGNHLSV